MKRIELHALGKARFTFTPPAIVEFGLERDGQAGRQVATPDSPMQLRQGDIVTVPDDCEGLDGMLQLGWAREIELLPEPEPEPAPEEATQE